MDGHAQGFVAAPGAEAIHWDSQPVTLSADPHVQRGLHSTLNLNDASADLLPMYPQEGRCGCCGCHCCCGCQCCCGCHVVSLSVVAVTTVAVTATVALTAAALTAAVALTAAALTAAVALTAVSRVSLIE